MRLRLTSRVPPPWGYSANIHTQLPSSERNASAGPGSQISTRMPRPRCDPAAGRRRPPGAGTGAGSRPRCACPGRTGSRSSRRCRHRRGRCPSAPAMARPPPAARDVTARVETMSGARQQVVAGRRPGGLLRRGAPGEGSTGGPAATGESAAATRPAANRSPGSIAATTPPSAHRSRPARSSTPCTALVSVVGLVHARPVRPVQ